MNKLYITIIALLCFSISLFSQWEQSSTGMNGGIVFALMVKDNVIYAACDQINSSGAGNVYRTTNNGLEWLSSRVGNFWIKCLAEKDNIIFAGTLYDSLYQSTDNGISWTKNTLNAVSIWSIAVLGNKLIATGTYGTYISTNNGVNWNINTNFTGRTLKVSGNKIFAGSNNGVYSSLDSGQTWNHILSINLPVEGLDLKDSYIYAGSYAGIYRSTNYGMNWGLSGIGWTLIPSLIAKDNFLLTGTGGFGIWRSTNYGSTYSQTNITDVSAYAFALKGINLFAGFTGNGVFISTDDGANWVQTELHNLRILSLFESGNEMYAGVVNKGVYHSLNNGLNWTHKSFQYEDISDFLSNENRLFAATLNDGLYYSSNNGINWIRSNLSANEVYFIDKYGNELYAGAESSGLFRSTNNGNNWQRIVPFLNTVRALSVHNGIMFISVENQNPGYIGVKFSTNMGRSWINTVFAGHRVLTLLSFNNSLFAGTEDAGIFKTTDNGLSWINLEIGSTDINCILDINNYLICGTGRGVYYSSNSGTNWLYLNNGLDSQRVYSLMISGNYLYAGTEANAVWKYDISQIIGISSISGEVPQDYYLYQNYPNPFNPSTKIRFSIPEFSKAAVIIYDITGRMVHTIADKEFKPGIYEADFHSKDLASGIYFCRLITGSRSFTRKIVLLK